MIRVCFDNVTFGSSSGPNTFGYRLAQQLIEDGIIVTSNQRAYDVFLTFIESRYIPRDSAKTVLRLDGIWFDRDRFDAANANIKRCYETYDQVVFQSEFDKNMAFKHFGKRENCSVISNGIKIEKFDPFEKLQTPNVYNFVCSASWHGQKRLGVNIEMFQRLRTQIKSETGKESKLLILGQGAENELVYIQKRDISKLQNVMYLGARTAEQCLRVYAGATAMLHLAWNDHCPNVVVEALSQQCPVICASSGGTSEIVGKNGIILQESTPYNYELVDDCKDPYPIILPRKLDLNNLLNLRGRMDISNIDIKNVSQKYIKLFDKEQG